MKLLKNDNMRQMQGVWRKRVKNGPKMAQNGVFGQKGRKGQKRQKIVKKG